MGVAYRALSEHTARIERLDRMAEVNIADHIKLLETTARTDERLLSINEKLDMLLRLRASVIVPSPAPK